MRWCLDLKLVFFFDWKDKKPDSNLVDGFDVSGLDTPWDEEEEEKKLVSTQMPVSQRRIGVCPTHERALRVDELVHLLDMKEEGLFS